MTPLWLLVLLCSPLCQPDSVEGWGASTVPSESECRPYIEKALKERSPQEAVDTTGSEQVVTPSSTPEQEGSNEETEETNKEESKEDETDEEARLDSGVESSETKEVTDTGEVDKGDTIDEGKHVQGDASSESEESGETAESTDEEEGKTQMIEEEGIENVTAEQSSLEDGSKSAESDDNITQQKSTEGPEDEPSTADQSDETPDEATTEEQSTEEEETKSEEETTNVENQGSGNKEAAIDKDSAEEKQDKTTEESVEKVDLLQEDVESNEDRDGEESVEVPGGEVTDSAETTESLGVDSNENTSKDLKKSEEETSDTSVENKTYTKQDSLASPVNLTDDESGEAPEENASTEESSETKVESSSIPNKAQSKEASESSEAHDDASSGSTEEKEPVVDSEEAIKSNITQTEGDQDTVEDQSESSNESEEQENDEAEETAREPEPTIEDQLTLEFEAPAVRRPRDHITEILHLSPEAAETELLLAKTIDSTLKELKKLYDVAIKPLEILFKYRDLSNRHFGDPEIFSKPLILFMGPWSGGKSTILNYLLDNEFKSSSLRTGAEPSPAYFNILMWGEREEVLDGTQLAADWTFSGLQKFGQGLLDRLRGLKLNSPLLEKVNIVEIPGILEIRKQVERLFPFNDACQWFIDRADIIFLVYDPSKLDVGPETEAILDQLKGREYQTRIILNKADQVKPEELMRVQGTLIWNISPLMSSSEPPVMYSTSLWSLPYEQGAPSRLLHAQERAFLRDLRQAVDKRVENKIASARRFAVRVRNHAKMVDCYLTTYYNHKSFFGNKKKVAEDIIEHPQNYHIYEGLSTLTNISRYDLPDPEVYRDFFRLNSLYDFQRLSDTCTYFRGCPINRLDVAIAYDLPELVGKYKKQAEKVLEIAVEKQATKS